MYSEVQEDFVARCTVIGILGFIQDPVRNEL
jgi:hypothetical protein